MCSPGDTLSLVKFDFDVHMIDHKLHVIQGFTILFVSNDSTMHYLLAVLMQKKLHAGW